LLCAQAEGASHHSLAETALQDFIRDWSTLSSDELERKAADAERAEAEVAAAAHAKAEAEAEKNAKLEEAAKRKAETKGSKQ
jgi:hypothetical protein